MYRTPEEALSNHGFMVDVDFSVKVSVDSSESDPGDGGFEGIGKGTGERMGVV